MSTIQFSYSKSVPVEYALEHYAHLSFPNLKTRISNKRIVKPLVAVMARKGNEVVGLSLATRNDNSVSEILSLRVKNDYRFNGIGKKLISQTVKMQQNLGYSQSRILFYEHWQNLSFVQTLIRDQFWSQPVPVMHRFEHHYEKNKQKILPAEIELSKEFSIKPFNHLSELTQNQLLSGELIPEKEDLKYSFKSYRNRFSKDISNILLQNEIPIGWCIAVIANEESIDHNLYILNEFRKDVVLPIALISKNWVTQMKSKYSRALWIIDASNKSMATFMERKLPHLIDFKSTLFAISKDLRTD